MKNKIIFMSTLIIFFFLTGFSYSDIKLKDITDSKPICIEDGKW